MRGLFFQAEHISIQQIDDFDYSKLWRRGCQGGLNTGCSEGRFSRTAANGCSASRGAARHASQEIVGEVLSRAWLPAQIEARSPSLEAMIAVWQAAAQVYPQQVALDDCHRMVVRPLVSRECGKRHARAIA